MTLMPLNPSSLYEIMLRGYPYGDSEPKMHLSSSRRTLGKIASTLGILQGLAWAMLALAAIILYNWSPDLDPPSTYSELVNAVLYAYFLKDARLNALTNLWGCIKWPIIPLPLVLARLVINGMFGIDVDLQFIIRPYDFTVFMWIYFLLSIVWFAISTDLLTALLRNKQRQRILMITWGTVVIVVSLIDLIFVCLLARDYTACRGGSTDIADMDYFCFLAVGIVMTIAARGYTLWLINVLFAIFILYIAVNVKKEEDKPESFFFGHSIPRVKIPKTDTTGSLPRDDDYITPSPTLPRTMEPQRPSFYSRGDKFSY